MSKGIDALKSALRVVFTAIQATSQADTDGNGKLSWLESLSLIVKVGMKLPSIYTLIPEIRAEWKDITPEELREIADYIATEFDLGTDKHDQLALLIKESAYVLVDGYDHYLKIAAILRKD